MINDPLILLSDPFPGYISTFKQEQLAYCEFIQQFYIDFTWLQQKMSDGQMTNILVHNILSGQQPTKTIYNQSQLISMHYEGYMPTYYAADIKNRSKCRSFYDEKKRMTDQMKKNNEQGEEIKIFGKDQKSFSEPKIIDLEFQKFNRSKSKRGSQKQVLSTHQYCSLMVQSMHQYFKRIEKGKKKRLQRCQKIKNFGVHIQPIKAQPDTQKIMAVLEKRRSFNQRKLMQNQMSTNDLSYNNDSIISQPQSKQLSKTISTSTNHTRRPNFLSKKIWHKEKKKDNERKLVSKMNRMFNHFNIILSSFAMYLDKSNQKQSFTNLLKNRKIQKKYTYYVGKGNNKNLIVSIFKKRWWWVEAEDISSANFVWTQLKIDAILQKQTSIAFSQLENLQPQLYTKYKCSKTQFFEDEYKKIYNIFHENHSKTFHTKLSLNQQKKYLRKMKIPQVIHNHYQANYMLGNKKALYYNISEYKQFKKQNVFQYIPLTFHVEKISSKAWKQFEKKMKELKNSLWIVKPGENTNRGQGIFVTNSIEAIKSKIQKSKKHTFIIQKYIKNNLTFQRRKFDIRTYLLMVTIGGVKKFYWYSEGYLRTSSEIYDLNDLDDPYIHLTNDAIQATSEKYGKFEKGNKVTYNEFQRYLDANYPNQKYQVTNLVARMKEIAKQVVQATYFKIDPSQKECSFELFGMDFLIDSSFRPWLLEVNTNPCLELSSPVLQRLIPRMIQNLFRIVVDPIFQPAQNEVPRNFGCYIPDNIIQSNRFQLIFDSIFDCNFQWQQYSHNKNSTKVYEDQNQQFENDGQLIKIQD